MDSFSESHFVSLILGYPSTGGAFWGACTLGTNSLVFWVHSKELIQLSPKRAHPPSSNIFPCKPLIV